MSSEYLTIPGSVALSPFRARALASSIKARDVQAQWVHYVHLAAAIQVEQLTVLEQLLEYGEPFTENPPSSRPGSSSGGLLRRADYHVAPRLGTISPWSSMATSIAHVCGLDGVVKRVERGMKVTCFFHENEDEGEGEASYLEKLHDRMTQSISSREPDLERMFSEHAPEKLETVPIYKEGTTTIQVLREANQRLGLALDESEVEYLADAYSLNGSIRRPPTDVELFMFAQVNSEHCRHKQFNANWIIDGERKPNTLFSMIRNTHKKSPDYTISAYSDNAAVLEGKEGSFFAPNPSTGEWTQTKEVVHFLAKVETHNHPTAVSPYPGAATGSGGEIRDEGSVGRGSKPKTGLTGFCVSDLLIPGHRQPWELDVGKPNHIASSLDIMLEAPLGGAAFNNEFGRPCTAGYFRTLLTRVETSNGESELRGYHKPIMIAGGVGTVRPQHAIKKPEIVGIGSHLIVIGGPAMLIGLGGGAASSITSGEGSVDLDFASVQRGNAEVQRRAQEVINACVAMGSNNPIKFIHDVGAGGLSNALPELVHDSDLGATFELREIDNADKGMSPMQIWCCEAQERYVVAVGEGGLETFKSIAKRERCGFSVVGMATGDIDGDKRLLLMDRDRPYDARPIDLPMSILFGKLPKMTRTVESRKLKLPVFDNSLKFYLPSHSDDELFNEAANRVLALPSVGSKSFLITIGDRTVGGLTARDQMVGPWQVPVADVSVTASSLLTGINTGEAMAMGEKPTVALISPAASARMAVAEALMNLAAGDLSDRLSRVKLSANWMAASSHPGQGAALYEAVEAIGMQLCPKLGVSIPVGKDSMSMKMKWKDPGQPSPSEVTAPLSLVISAFAPVSDIKKTWTPALQRPENVGETSVFFVDLSMGRRAMGGSALAQVLNQVGDRSPDLHYPELLKDFFDATSQLQDVGIVLAYHDRSDGGLFTTLSEMMFAGRCGLEIMLDGICPSPSLTDVIPCLFNEELGCVFQVRKKDEHLFKSCFSTCGPPPGLISKIGRVSNQPKQNLAIYHGMTLICRRTRSSLQQRWSHTSHQLQRLRDNPTCADSEYASVLDDTNPGLRYKLTFNPSDHLQPLSLFGFSSRSFANKPRVAVLREQGVNGASEMAFAFSIAGFSAIDVHMTDLLSGRVSLSTFTGLAACGGFSYGDVLGAGQGWAKSVLLHSETRREFQQFFERPDTFTLGVCNGCQFLSRLKSLIPGAEAWPSFERNESEQYEARVAMVEVLDNPAHPSVFLHDMAGSKLPVAVAHGEGRVTFSSSTSSSSDNDNPVKSSSSPSPSPAESLLDEKKQVSFRFVDNHLHPTTTYPFNPNGSPLGITGVRTPEGRVLAMMPHPERTVMGGIGSWIPREGLMGSGEKDGWGDFGPWARMFFSARRWVG